MILCTIFTKGQKLLKNGFFKQYGEDIGKLKTLAEVRNKQRDNNYADAREWHNCNKPL
jgi:hypothetical protein